MARLPRVDAPLPGRNVAIRYAVPDDLDTLTWYMARIKEYVVQSIGDPLVMDAARKVVSGCPPYNDECETSEVYRWVLRHWRYTKSPSRFHIEDLIRPVKALEDIRDFGRACGECENMTILIASMLCSLNHRIALMWGGETVTHKGRPFDNYRHVWLADYLPRHGWVSLDPTGYLPPGKYFDFETIGLDEIIV